MQHQHNPVASLIKTSLIAVIALTLVPQIQAAEEKKADPSGTWTWTMPSRSGGQDRKMTLKLKVEADKVTGKLESPGRDGQTTETEIKDGKLKGDEVSFTVVREFNGNKFTSKYNGKISADSIKGKIEFDRNGETQTRDWEAKREAEKK